MNEWCKLRCANASRCCFAFAQKLSEMLLEQRRVEEEA